MTRKSAATLENLRILQAGLAEEAMAMKKRTLAAQLALQNSIAESEVSPDEVADIIKQRIEEQKVDYSLRAQGKLTTDQQRFLDSQASKKNQPK